MIISIGTHVAADKDIRKYFFRFFKIFQDFKISRLQDFKISRFPQSNHNRLCISMF